MELQQKLKECKKEEAENQEGIRHYQKLHDKLSLEEIEWVEQPLYSDQLIIYDSDEEEADDGTTKPSTEDSKEGILEVPKVEIDRKPIIDPFELKVYSADELKTYNKKTLVADVTLLEGSLNNNSTSSSHVD